MDRLQRRWSALTASLVLGVAWAVWHAPSFLLPGYSETWDFAPDPLPYGASNVLTAVLSTWLYNNTARSVLGVVVFHFLGNTTGQLFELSPRAD